MKRVITSILICCLLLLGGLTYYALVISPMKTCRKDFARMEMILLLYSQDSENNSYPPLDPRPGHLSPDITAIEQLILSGEELTNPEGQIHLSVWFETIQLLLEGEQHYWYVPYPIWDKETGNTYIQVYKQAVKEGTGFEGDIFNQAKKDARDKLSEFANRHDPDTDYLGKSCFPVLIERPGYHYNGSHVTFMDGHVEFIKYPGYFPMTEDFIQGLESLDALKE